MVAIPVEAGHDIFAAPKAVPVYDAAVAAANAALGNDELLPAHGGADDLATGVVADEQSQATKAADADPSFTMPSLSLVVPGVAELDLGLEKLSAEDREVVERLVGEALKADGKLEGAGGEGKVDEEAVRQE